MAVKDNKNVWIIVIVAIIGAVFLLSNFGSITGQQAVVPKIVRANSCDADDTCETKGLLAREDINLADRFIIEMADNGTFGDPTFRARTKFEKHAQFSGISVEQDVSARSGYFNGAIQTQSLYVTGGNGSLRANSLSGSGNAYACVDRYGKFYRSSSPCA